MTDEELGFIPHWPGGAEAINADSFDEDVCEASGPVLVEFWAARCGPCRRIAPELERLAKALGPRLRVFTVNVDEELDVAVRCDVLTIPATLLFIDGREVGRLVGETTKAALEDFLAAHGVH